MPGRARPTRPARTPFIPIFPFFLSPAPRRSLCTLAAVRRLRWLSTTLSAVGSDSAAAGSIPVKEEVTSEPSQEHTQEPETNEELDTPSSSVPDSTSVPETHIPKLEGSDDEEEHPKAQAQALRDY
ncbi:hypothetical protein M9H77_34419 [Catharanthus roseus]|uniref:Uncharacterized protein n=1 Tax=Catharanthus roseus TaxID=4058 RepID=A0ACB9ZM05_CATRO|nr:hypothetical protein M9H77_34419 [Catharanthus roseus]